MSAPDFWEKREKAQQAIAELRSVRGVIEPFQKLDTQVQDFLVLVELVEAEGEGSDMLPEADETQQRLLHELEALEVVSFLSGRFDRNNAYLTIHAGQGGAESCDWASMLLRMYDKWIEKHGFRSHMTEISEAEIAGIKSATLVVEGDFAYGYLQAERGVHRLVRISPFDANKRRHTSFAAIEVVPEIDDEIEVQIDPKDIREDTYRSSGAGGQHVNTTDSAVRLTHIPTGFFVACQSERSQHQNRATAWKMLRAKLYERQVAELDKTLQQESGTKEENTWGSQIRSYVLQPYQMVKDLRTGEETSNTGAVLDGDLDRFIEAWLKAGKPHAKKQAKDL